MTILIPIHKLCQNSPMCSMCVTTKNRMEHKLKPRLVKSKSLRTIIYGVMFWAGKCFQVRTDQADHNTHQQATRQQQDNEAPQQDNKTTEKRKRNRKTVTDQGLLVSQSFPLRRIGSHRHARTEPKINKQSHSCVTAYETHTL